MGLICLGVLSAAELFVLNYNKTVYQQNDNFKYLACNSARMQPGSSKIMRKKSYNNLDITIRTPDRRYPSPS
jgi:hypothetical protein